MRAAVFSVTRRGAELSKRIANAFPDGWNVTRFCFERYPADGAEPFANLAQKTAEVFPECGAVVFVCACGIAVRAVAPLIKSKQTDPAVVVLDDCGKFAVSLLSGHLGGANRMTEIIAEAVGAQPVITTATDAGGRFSPDCFAAANRLIFKDFSAAKELASAVLRGEKIGLISDIECVNIPSDVVRADSGKYGICISRDMSAKPFGITLNMAPKNIVLGVGSKKGAEFSALTSLVRQNLTEMQLTRVCEVATIDRKANEPCILRLCQELKVPLKIYTAEQLAEVKGSFSMSEFVQSTVGVDNVCERSASVGGNTLIIRKQAGCGVTLAAAERKVLIDFSRKQQ